MLVRERREWARGPTKLLRVSSSRSKDSTHTHAAPLDASAATRAESIMLVAVFLNAQRPGHPLRVAIDGVTASGKTTLADEIKDELERLGRPAIRLSMDGFHHPRVRRYQQGRNSARGYYEDAFDFDSLARHVLVPLGPEGDSVYKEAVIDLSTDAPVDGQPLNAARSAVLIVDGSFLQRAEIARLWDVAVFVDTSLEVARRRGTTRDAVRLGGIKEAEHAFTVRYHAASQIYLDEVQPAARADMVIFNDDLEHPRVLLQTGDAES